MNKKWREALQRRSDAERNGGARMFMGRPDRWWDAGKFRCENGHISTTVLKSEGLGRDACLDCYGEIAITFPEDVDGLLGVTDGC